MKKGIGLAAVVLLAIGLIAVSRANANSTTGTATSAASWEAYLPPSPQIPARADLIYIYKWDRISDIATPDPLSPFQP